MHTERQGVRFGWAHSVSTRYGAEVVLGEETQGRGGMDQCAKAMNIS